MAVAVGAQDTPVERQCTVSSGSSPRSGSLASDAQEGPAPTARILFLLSAVSLVEGMDDAMLPAVAYAMQDDLDLSLTAITSMSMIQALTMAAFAPLWGTLADKEVVSRKLLIVVGCLLQGVVTVLLAFTSDYPWMMVLRALNGVMLASLKPIAVSMLSGLTSETNRGKSFAWIPFSASLGMMLGFVIGAPISRKEVAGMDGWRISFIGIGAVSIIVGALVHVLMVEPPRQRAAPGKTDGASIGSMLLGELAKILHYFTLPSFVALIAQGCIGLVPWKALNYQTLYFQVAGLGDFQSGALQASNLVASAFGNLLGGKVGDSFARRWPNHGRAFTAQISVVSGIPIAALIFMVSAPQGWAFPWYLFLVVSLGLLASWCAVGVNWPILTQIVTPDNRGAVMAWEAAVEGSFASVVGNLAVSFFAETLLGFNLKDQEAQAKEGGGSENMSALGFALTMTSAVPWAFCLVFYTMLHWSLPRDLRRMQELAAASKAGAPRKEEAPPSI
jgi:MFS family permease